MELFPQPSSTMTRLDVSASYEPRWLLSSKMPPLLLFPHQELQDFIEACGLPVKRAGHQLLKDARLPDLLQGFHGHWSRAGARAPNATLDSRARSLAFGHVDGEDATRGQPTEERLCPHGLFSNDLRNV